MPQTTKESSIFGARVSRERKSQRRSASEPQAAPPGWTTNEISSLRREICEDVPAKGTSYWKSNKVWIGCIDIDANSGYQADSAVRNLEVTIKVVGRTKRPDVWEYFRRNEGAMLEMLRHSGDGGVQVVDYRVTQGSIEIILIIGFVKAGITLAGLVLGFMGAFANYDKTKAGFNDAMADCKAFVEKLKYRLRLYFDGFGSEPGLSES